MSDDWVILLPESPDYVPAEGEQSRAIDRFHEIAPRADEVVAELTDNVRFIDCGANLEHISCPTCGEEIDIRWWQDWVDEEWGMKFPLLLRSLPCCSIQHSLNELLYDWPQGFARFSVEAMNPDIGRMSPLNIQEFETILGCKLRVIYRHL